METTITQTELRVLLFMDSPEDSGCLAEIHSVVVCLYNPGRKKGSYSIPADLLIGCGKRGSSLTLAGWLGVYKCPVRAG